VKDRFVVSERQRSILFGAVLEFMSRCGAAEDAIRESFEKSVIDLRDWKVKDRLGRGSGQGVQTQNLPALLLRAWHRDARYIDHEANPLPLPLSRGRNNLSTVIRRIDPSANTFEILRSMKAVGLIRRTSRGRYIPTSEAAIVDQLHPLLIEHVTKLVSRLIGTISRNTTSKRDSISLIDRHAYTASLNPVDRAAFAEFSRSQGMAYLESIDDWLAQRQVRQLAASRSTKARGIAAGVYLFAYLGDNDEGDTDHVPGGASRVRKGYIKKKTQIRRKPPIPSREARA
jgi:hypothetical protein